MPVVSWPRLSEHHSRSACRPRCRHLLHTPTKAAEGPWCTCSPCVTAVLSAMRCPLSCVDCRALLPRAILSASFILRACRRRRAARRDALLHRPPRAACRETRGCISSSSHSSHPLPGALHVIASLLPGDASFHLLSPLPLLRCRCPRPPASHPSPPAAAATFFSLSW